VGTSISCPIVSAYVIDAVSGSASAPPTKSARLAIRRRGEISVMVRLLKRWMIDLSPSTGQAIGAASAGRPPFPACVAKLAMTAA
jgi:hypothetical protein